MNGAENGHDENRDELAREAARLVQAQRRAQNCRRAHSNPQNKVEQMWCQIGMANIDDNNVDNTYTLKERANNLWRSIAWDRRRINNNNRNITTNTRNIDALTTRINDLNFDDINSQISNLNTRIAELETFKDYHLPRARRRHLITLNAMNNNMDLWHTRQHED